VLAAVALTGADGARGRAAREREVKQAIETVAAYLGNTPAVCRASYVDPRVIDRFHAGVTITPAIREGGLDLGRPRVRARVERAVLELLEDG
jgi:DNA topoisomerase IB